MSGRAHLSDVAGELARTAAAAIGGDFVGIDLLPQGDDAFTVLELNAAVDVDDTYSLDGGDVYEAVAAALGLPPARVAARPALRFALSG